jgi:hypothetical protein
MAHASGTGLAGRAKRRAGPNAGRAGTTLCPLVWAPIRAGTAAPRAPGR